MTTEDNHITLGAAIHDTVSAVTATTLEVEYKDDHPVRVAQRLTELEKAFVKLTNAVSDIAEQQAKTIETINAMALHLRELPNNPAFLAAMITRMDEMLRGVDERKNATPVAKMLNPITVEEVATIAADCKVIRIQRKDDVNGLPQMELTIRWPNNDGTKFGYIEADDADVQNLGLDHNTVTYLMDTTADLAIGEYRFYEVIDVVSAADYDADGTWVEVDLASLTAVSAIYSLVVAASRNDKTGELEFRLVDEAGMADLVEEVTVEQVPELELLLPTVEGVPSDTLVYYAWMPSDIGVVAPESFQTQIDVNSEASSVITELDVDMDGGMTHANMVMSTEPFPADTAADTVRVQCNFNTGQVLVSPQLSPEDIEAPTNPALIEMYLDLAKRSEIPVKEDGVAVIYVVMSANA